MDEATALRGQASPRHQACSLRRKYASGFGGMKANKAFLKRIWMSDNYNEIDYEKVATSPLAWQRDW
jgi:hypothetical protein